MGWHILCSKAFEILNVRARKSAIDRKAEIERVALRLAFDVGPDRVTTGMIADQLSLTQPAIYKHFPSKSDIWNAIADRLTSGIAENIARAKEAEVPPEARLRVLVMGHLQLVEENPALPEIMVMRDSHDAPKALRSRMQGSMTDFRNALVFNVKAAMMDGTFRAGIDARDASTLIFGIIQSLVLRMMITRNPAILLEDGERLLNLQLSGFAQPGEK